MFDYLRRLATTGAAYTASSVLSKLIAVALLPLYTRYLTPADYGAAEVMVVGRDRDVDRDPPRRDRGADALLLPRRRGPRAGRQDRLRLALLDDHHRRADRASVRRADLARRCSTARSPTSSGSRSAASGSSRSTSTSSRSSGSTSARRRTSSSRWPTSCSRSRSPSGSSSARRRGRRASCSGQYARRASVPPLPDLGAAPPALARPRPRACCGGCSASGCRRCRRSSRSTRSSSSTGSSSCA